MNQRLYDTNTMQANLGFVVKQTTYIETQVYQARYPQIKYPGLIPVDYSAPEWIKSVTYYSTDAAGKAEWLADRASDIPTVDLARGSSETQVVMAGIGYDYGLEEVSQAMMLGVPLETTKANSARFIYEQFVDRIAFFGDKLKGFEGLFNSTKVTAENAAHGNWATAKPDDIVADINKAIIGMLKDTNELAIADTILLPSELYQSLVFARIGDTTMTALEFIAKANVYTSETGKPLTIRGMLGLNGAGAGGTNRMVAYRNNPDVLKLHIPMAHKFLPVQVAGLTYKVPGIFRLGGLDIRLPREVRYVDGI